MLDSVVVRRLRRALKHAEDAHADCMELKVAGELRVDSDPEASLQEAIRHLRKSIERQTSEARPPAGEKA
jgi:hypothetical protein